MNLVEVYVYNITKEEKVQCDGFSVWKLIADINCYGRKHEQVTLIMSKSDYESVKEKGYYLG